MIWEEASDMCELRPQLKIVPSSCVRCSPTLTAQSCLGLGCSTYFFMTAEEISNITKQLLMECGPLHQQPF